MQRDCRPAELVSALLNLCMRLWTLHPRYLDTKGLVAAWREALLAQKVLSGATRGYRNHPQLLRFRDAVDPQAAIARFLHEIAAEAGRRGYRFDISKISRAPGVQEIRETHGQLSYEWSHLKQKLRARDPVAARRLRGVAEPEPHPLFRIITGEVREWEKRPAGVAGARKRKAPLAPASKSQRRTGSTDRCRGTV